MAANKTYDEIRVGDEASLTRVCTANLFIFAHASGNLNPLHLPKGTKRQGAGSDRTEHVGWLLVFGPTG